MITLKKKKKTMAVEFAKLFSTNGKLVLDEYFLRLKYGMLLIILL